MRTIFACNFEKRHQDHMTLRGLLRNCQECRGDGEATTTPLTVEYQQIPTFESRERDEDPIYQRLLKLLKREPGELPRGKVSYLQNMSVQTTRNHPNRGLQKVRFLILSMIPSFININLKKGHRE